MLSAKVLNKTLHFGTAYISLTGSIVYYASLETVSDRNNCWHKLAHQRDSFANEYYKCFNPDFVPQPLMPVLLSAVVIKHLLNLSDEDNCNHPGKPKIRNIF